MNKAFVTMLRHFFQIFWPLLFICTLWVIFSSPYFFQGKVPFPSSYLVNHFPPWSSYQKYWGPVKNDAMPDIIDQIYPWRYLSVESWKKGEIPLWNPYNFSGNPHLANFQSAALSPFTLLFFLIPFLDGFSIIVLLQPLLAGIFTYFFVREIKLSKQAAFVSSISFMFCGFIVVWMAYGTLSMAIAFLPLTLFAIERGFRKFSLSIGFLLSMSLMCSIFSGHFQTSLYLLFFSGFYLLVKAIGSPWQRTLRMIVFYFFGIFLSFIQIIPSINLYNESVRSNIFILSGGIPFQYLITLFAPDVFGNPVTRNDWMGNYAEWASFVGIVPIFLLFFSVHLYKNRLVQFFLLSSVVVLILAVSSPVQQLLGNLHIPVLSTSNPNRIIVIFSFTLSVLAGFGLESIEKLLEKQDKKRILFSLMGFFLMLGIVWLSIITLKFIPAEKLYIAKKNMLLPSFIAGLLIFITGFFMLHILRGKRYFFIFVMLGLMSFDSMRFAMKWMPFDKRELVYPDTPVIKAMQNQIGHGRFFGNLGGQVATYYGLRSIEGYDPLYSQRYGEFLRAAQTGKLQNAERSVAKIDRHAKYIERVLDILGVNIIFNPIADTNQSWAYPVWENPEKYSVIYHDKLFQLMRNNYAIKRPALFFQYVVVPDARKNIETFYSDSFDYRHKIILEKDPGIPSEREVKNHEASIDYLVDDLNKIIVKVYSDSQALLFFSDTFYPSWKVTVNGKAKELLRADYGFRAVVVPKGESVVKVTDTLVVI